MRGDDFNSDGVRSHKRKRQRADKILNISIGIVILLILLVGAQFLLGGDSEQPVVSDNLEENDEETVEEESDTTEPSDSDDPADSIAGEEEKKEPQSSEDASNEDSQSDSTGTDQGTAQQGEWEPIGTVQPEPFAAVYNKDHINWEEMTKAFQYATGLADDMVLWHVGNGGNHESAVGVVANYSNRTTPYKVRIEWVTNEGWKPVSVEQLQENIYIKKYANTSEENQDENDDSSQ